MLFFPLIFTVYWTIPHRYRWFLLLLSSYYFYMSWNPKYIVLILFTTAVSYTSALFLDWEAHEGRRRFILFLTLAVCLGVLFFYKYFNFFSLSFSSLASFFLPVHPVLLQLVLPVGISFYTFQTLSYVIDVYQGRIKAERHFGIYAAFIAFFPSLLPVRLKERRTFFLR